MDSEEEIFIQTKTSKWADRQEKSRAKRRKIAAADGKAKSAGDDFEAEVSKHEYRSIISARAYHKTYKGVT